jgi:hypothetical protein
MQMAACVQGMHVSRQALTLCAADAQIVLKPSIGKHASYIIMITNRPNPL